MKQGRRRLLTQQFYDWERCGRGWHLFRSPVDLEPGFVPFFGHYVDGQIIDDGIRPSLWQRLFIPNQGSEGEATADQEPDQVLAYDFDEYGDPVIYTVAVPKGYGASPAVMEQCLTMLSLSGQTTSFEIVATASAVTLQFGCRPANAYWLHAQLKAYLPECSIAEAEEDRLRSVIDDAETIYATDFGLAEEFMRPIATYEGKAISPYAALFGLIDQLQGDEALAIQALFCGTCNQWAESITASVSDGMGRSFFYDAPEMPDLAKEKTARPLVGATLRIVATSRHSEDSLRLISHGSMAMLQASRSPFNAITPLNSSYYGLEQRLQDIVLRQSHRMGMLINVRELATFAHVPSASLSKKLLAGNRATKRAPAHLNASSYVLGTNEHQGKVLRVGIDTDQRTRHLHLIGGSGVGKSTMLHSLICQDIRNGTGCCVLDPHGDLIENILGSISEERIKDVVLIDPSDSGYPIGFNVLSAHSDLERELLASDLVSLFRRFSTSWGDNLHSILANAIMAFLYNSKPGHLGELRKFLIEPAYRAQVLATCTDEELCYYWRVEYPLVKSSSIGSILTRLDSFLRPRIVRNMVCQHRGLDFAALMDSSKIILVKLSLGLIGAENSYLLGACIVAKLQQCAMARQEQLAQDRVPFFCYIDEFHHFVTESMGTILSGTRKFGLGLVVAHHNMMQLQRLDDSIAGALMSNVGTRVCFRLSDTDAKRMQEGFSGFGADDLQNLEVGQAIARVNTADADFNLAVIPADHDHKNRDAIVAWSRQRYATPIEPGPQTSREEHEPPATASRPEPEPAILNELQEMQQRELREHRYLQTLIKTMAEQSGYRAQIELPTPDGKGQVDVSLQKGNEKIAVEVSVSTGADWELHNIRKCLAAGYAKIVVCSPKPARLLAIQKKIASGLPAQEQARIMLLAPDQIPAIFAAATAHGQPAERVMKGYRVTVRYEDGACDPSKGDIIKRIVKGKK